MNLPRPPALLERTTPRTGDRRAVPGPNRMLKMESRTVGFGIVAGVDDVSCGALAGPVFAASVVFDDDDVPDGLQDSRTRFGLPSASSSEARLTLLHAGPALEPGSVRLQAAPAGAPVAA